MENTIKVEKENANKLFQVTFDSYELYLEFYRKNDVESARKFKSEFRNFYRTIEMLGLEREYYNWKDERGLTDNEE